MNKNKGRNKGKKSKKQMGENEEYMEKNGREIEAEMEENMGKKGR